MHNLINEAVFNTLPYQLVVRDPGNVRIIGGGGEALYLKGFAVFPVTLGTSLIWHEFGVLRGFPLELLISAEILAPHHCSMYYFKINQ